eukprot:COSAG03_NODE_20799_length_313_cov_1.392523_2_plen_61_part_01
MIMHYDYCTESKIYYIMHLYGELARASVLKHLYFTEQLHMREERLSDLRVQPHRCRASPHR